MARPKKKKEEKIDENIALHKVMGDINKRMKKPMLRFGNEWEEKEKLPFGISKIDDLIGGGLLAGNFHILYGGESSGKTSMAYSQIANAQKNGKTCVLIDMEHSFNPRRAKLFGVNIKKLILIDACETAEEAMDIVRKLSQEKVVDLIVVDSIQAMAPKGMMYTAKGAEKSIEKDTMALLARTMSKFLSTTAGFVYNGKVCILLIGQTRTGNLGGFVPMDVCSGGKAKDFWSQLTLKIRRGAKSDAPITKYKEYYMDGDKERFRTKERICGFDIVLKIDKHKLTDCQPEGSELHLPFYFETGFEEPEIESGEDNE